MTPLEGMASGVPFVATDAGYYRSFSGQGQTGIIVPDDDADAVVQALDEMLSAPKLYEAMSTASRKAVETHFSIRSEADGIKEVYEALWADR